MKFKVQEKVQTCNQAYTTSTQISIHHICNWNWSNNLHTTSEKCNNPKWQNHRKLGYDVNTKGP